jgi:hypothetical protein
MGSLVESADAKHSTSAASESEVLKNAPRDNQKVPASPKQPNSILVDIGLLSLMRVNTSSDTITIRLALHTNIANGIKRVRSDVASKPCKCTAIAKQITVQSSTVA